MAAQGRPLSTRPSRGAAGPPRPCMARVDDPIRVGVEDRPEGLYQRAARQVVGGEHDRQERDPLARDRSLDDVPLVAEANARAAMT